MIRCGDELLMVWFIVYGNWKSIYKMGSTIEEVTEWEQKVEDYQDNFQKISEVIKVLNQDSII